MNKVVLWAFIVVAGIIGMVAVAGVIRFNVMGGGDVLPSGATGLSDLSVTIDGQQFQMDDGVAEIAAAPGSAITNTLRIVGEPVLAGPDTAGNRDAALIVVNDSGGSGRFYYALAAVAQADSYRATNVLPLGDRITPQITENRDGRFIYHYLGRGPDQPMSEPPTVENTLTVRLDRVNGVITAQP